MHNPASVPENETHKLLWDFEIKTDHLISARRPDLTVINKKRTCRIVNFAVLADHRVKLKERKKKDKYLDFTRELKKTVEYEINIYIYYNNWYSWYSHRRIIKGTGGLGNKMNGDHYSWRLKLHRKTIS